MPTTFPFNQTNDYKSTSLLKVLWTVGIPIPERYTCQFQIALVPFV